MRRTPHPRGGDFAHPLNISDILSVCHDRQDLLPGILTRLRERHRYGDLPPWSYIRLRDSNLKFYIEGRFVGRYDRRRTLRRIVFLFRNTEEEITRKFILGMALSQTKIFPWFFDLGHNRMVIDERWFAHLGLPAGDGTIGPEDFFRLVHPEDRGRLADAFAKQLAGELNPDTFTYRLRREDGTWEWFEEQSVYLGQTGNGSPCRIVGICQSIHAHKTSEDGLRAARDKARESDRLKSAFLANMSHEIRTPLNAIVGFSGILASTDEEQEKQEYVSIIENNNALLLQLIGDILDLSKIEAGTLDFIHTDFDLNELMREKENVIRMKVREGVELLFEQKYEQCSVCTDRNRLSQVIINLLTNAAKFTQTGSIRFGYEMRGKELYFWVSDTGSGIPADKTEQVFDRFVKLNAFKQGTGLGLSICKMIVEHLGGRIGVESEEGKGSKFWFILPYVPGKAAAQRTEEQYPAVSVEKNKLMILIAEDNDSNYRLFESILRKEYTLLHAWNGQEAVEIYRQHRPHLVLMDINMPVMNGYEATAEIRKLSESVPIIAVTAFAFASDEQKVLQSGFDGYMAKPINALQLRTQIVDMLRKHVVLL